MHGCVCPPLPPHDPRHCYECFRPVTRTLGLATTPMGALCEAEEVREKRMSASNVYVSKKHKEREREKERRGCLLL